MKTSKSFTITLLISFSWILYMMFLNMIFPIGPIVVLPSLIGFGRIWFLFFDNFDDDINFLNI